MPQCPYCRERFIGHPDFCPACSKRLTETVFDESDDNFDANNFQTGSEFEIDEDELDDAVVTVARFHNAAEAGYFSHELMRVEEIPSMVKIDEHFDALSGGWSTRFLLLVPERFAEAAAVALQRLVEQSNSEEYEYFDQETQTDFREASHEMEPFGDEMDFDRDSAAESGVNWVPIVLTLAAGSAAFWGVRKLQDRPQPHANAAPQGARQQDLWDRLSGSPEPWVQQSEDGNRTRSIRFETQGNVVIIREDSDGDGHFEREHQIRRGTFNQR